MFHFLRRHRRQHEQQAERSPIDTYESTGRALADAPERARAILQLAEENHRRRQPDVKIPAVPERRPGLPVTGQDDAALFMLSGARFGPNARVILPSGRTLNAQEAQTWTDLYRAPEESQ